MYFNFQDHTLRIFRLNDYLGVYTLHGHCGPITSIFVDNMDGTHPLAAGNQIVYQVIRKLMRKI